MTTLSLASFALLVAQVSATPQGPPAQPAGPPATEVYVAALTLADGTASIGKPENISNSPGYDNQPVFARDGRSLYFTSARGALASKCGTPQTDIYRYDLKSRTVGRVTQTSECEYSPTITPDGDHLSVIRVEPDGAQRLWRFTIDGRDPSVVLRDIKPVGYHAWLDARTLVLFVLGQPATLQVANTVTGTAEVVASNIGQSIQKIPGGGVSFVQQEGQGADRTSRIVQLTIEKGKVILTPLVTSVAGVTQPHVAWTPDGTLLMAAGDRLYAWRAGAPEWRNVTDLGARGLRNVTRLAISPGGNHIAIVAAGR